MTTSQTGHSNPTLLKPGTLRRLIIGFAGVLVAVVALQFVIPIKPHFPAEGIFAAAAIYGFGTCLLMVVFAWLLGKLLKRREGYYERPEDD